MRRLDRTVTLTPAVVGPEAGRLEDPLPAEVDEGHVERLQTTPRLLAATPAQGAFRLALDSCCHLQQRL